MDPTIRAPETTKRLGREVRLEPSDRALAEAVIERGEEAAFRALYRRHTPRLYLFVLRLLGGTAMDAEDAVQETWMRVCRRIGTFRWDSSFATWLTSIGVHVAQDALRRRGRDPLIAAEDPPELPAPPAGIADRIDLDQAIAALPDGCRQVLVLHDVEGMTHTEIGALLGIAEGTSKSQLSAARSALRSLLAEVEHA